MRANAQLVRRNPEPHGVPLAVTGQQLATEVQQTLGDRVDEHQAADAASARRAVLHRDAVAALGPDGDGGLRLDVPAANGLSTTNAVTGPAAAYANQAGQHPETADIVPLAKFDSRGLCGFYVAFGVTLAGFVLAQNTLGLSRVLPLRYRFRLIWGFSAACGTIAAAIAGPALGALPAPFLPLAGTLALLAAATALTTTLPGLARVASGLLPPGAAARAVADLSCLGGAHVAGPLITPRYRPYSRH